MLNSSIVACEVEAVRSYYALINSFNPDDVKAFLPLPSSRDKPNISSVADGIATIRIAGYLSNRRASILEAFLGIDMTSYVDILDALKSAEQNSEVENIVLNVHSPGGSVDGVDGVWSAIRRVKQKKPVIAFNNGFMASAAYWIASAADSIIAASPIAETGSIGVIITATDFSKAEQAYGIRHVKILSKNAPDKSPDVSSDEGIEVLQRRVDALERIFISRVAEGRGKTQSDVVKNFGRGGLLVAQDPDGLAPDALSVGMIDRLGSEAFSVVEEGDSSATEKTGCAKLPTLNIVDGKMSAVDNGAYAVEGARNTLNTPESDRVSVNRHIDQSKTKIKNQKGKAMNPEELLVQHPELSSYLKNLESTAYKNGAESVEQKISKVLPYLKAEYPDAVKNLALNVLGGTEDFSVLRGAVIALDMLTAKGVKDNAAQESAEVPSIAGANAVVGNQASVDGTVRSMADYDRLIASMKGVK
jgi:signal peptide peptidase SppA